MKKVWTAISTFFLAAKCSAHFCFRNAPWLTSGRVFMTVIGAVVTYLSVASLGYVVNAIEETMRGGFVTSLQGFVESDLGKGSFFLFGVALLGMLNGRLMWYVTNMWNHELRVANQRELNEHRVSLDVGEFRGKRYDDLTTQINDIPGSWALRLLFADQLVGLVSSVVMSITFGMALLTHSTFYFISIGVVSFIMIYGDFRTVNMWWNTYKKQTPLSKRKGMLEKAYLREEAFTQAKMFNQAVPLRKEIDRNTSIVLQMYDTIRRATLKRDTTWYLLGMCALFLVTLHVMWSAASGIVSLGAFTVIIASARQFQSGIDNVGVMLADQWNSARGVILIEKDFMGMKPVVVTKDPVSIDIKLPPRVCFRNVCFAYPEQHTLVLKDINLCVEPMMKLAIVGLSGSGKSSLFSLFLRHYDPTSGEITVNGTSLTSIEPKTWAECASGLTQNYIVLNRTVEEEIASSKLGQKLDREKVERASRLAAFLPAIANDPKGFETQIGTSFGGREFSGGEKQRLALARVWYKETPIVIFDEPDSSLDPNTAEEVINNIFSITGQTVVIITHHVSRASRCDKIALLHEGEIVEFGTHQELMALKGKYAKMFGLDKKRLSLQS